jgi:lipopolysaccharide/colanic/teichoic acid biosynthesis glycosyltransferase
MNSRRPRRYDGVKRCLDLVIALIVFCAALPIQVVVAILVVRNFGRPVFFTQQRPGRNGRVFTLIKFRTMRRSDPASGMLSDRDRLTPFGQRLRSTSLDELPTLLNVIKGDMSIVGPRPLLVEYLGRYTEQQARRHEVRPGVTGLAQVSGRNSIGWEKKFALDVDYVDRRSFRLDAAIVLRTFAAVLKREGISADGHVTTDPFLGGAADNSVRAQ